MSEFIKQKNKENQGFKIQPLKRHFINYTFLNKHDF